ncbi:MAG: hypothetical protein ACQEQO_03315 [Thermodesulfobacteriota bacterium]
MKGLRFVMMEKIIDYLVLLCAAWIIVARLFFMQIRFATIAAAIILILQVIKLVRKKDIS